MIGLELINKVCRKANLDFLAVNTLPPWVLYDKEIEKAFLQLCNSCSNQETFNFSVIHISNSIRTIWKHKTDKEKELFRYLAGWRKILDSVNELEQKGKLKITKSLISEMKKAYKKKYELYWVEAREKKTIENLDQRIDEEIKKINER